MKTTLFILCLICATAAFGQTASVLPNNSQPIQIYGNPQHASQHELAQPQDILDTRTTPTPRESVRSPSSA